MISRRRFTMGVVIALTPLGATASAQEYKAQPAGKVYRIGILGTAHETQYFEELRQGLQELGWVEGRNLSLEIRSAEGQAARLSALATGLVDLKRRSVDGVRACAMTTQPDRCPPTGSSAPRSVSPRSVFCTHHSHATWVSAALMT